MNTPRRAYNKNFKSIPKFFVRAIANAVIIVTRIKDPISFPFIMICKGYIFL